MTAPSVAITAPTEGAVFAAPANVSFTADTSAGVTNVSYFNGRTLLGSSQTAPFNITAASLAAGAYTVSAVATTSGTSTTSSLVHFTVVDPVATSLSAPAINNGLFSFNYSANQGLTYIIQKASSLNSAGTSDWTPVATNVASSGSATFSEPVSSDAARFYRVARVPNP